MRNLPKIPTRALSIVNNAKCQKIRLNILWGLAGVAIICLACSAASSAKAEDRQAASSLSSSKKKAAEAILFRPVEAEADIKQSDFRFNPPRPLDIRVKAHEKRALIEITYAADKRLPSSLVIRPDDNDKEIIFKETSSPADLEKGTQVFSSIVDLDVKAIAASHKRLVDDLLDKKTAIVIREFKGREVASIEPITARLNRLKKDLELFFRDERSGISLFAFNLDFLTMPIDPHKTLLITEPKVVGDVTRSSVCKNGLMDGLDDSDPMGKRLKKWTFGHLMEEMANEAVTGINPSDFALHWLQHWQWDQTINSFNVLARSSIKGFLIDKWPKLSPPTCPSLPCPDGSGRLDLSKAPFKLLAIVNRIDLALNLAYGRGSGGEARFVFAVTNGCDTANFTVIVEYGVPRHSCGGLQDWANEWINLQNVSIPILSTGEFDYSQYNNALETLTEKFVKANVEPSRPNGSALNQVRTNELVLGSRWELREFQIWSGLPDFSVQTPSPISGYLSEVTIKQTPDRNTFNSSHDRFTKLDQGQGLKASDLAAWITSNSSSIKNDRHSVPRFWPIQGVAFLGGNALNDEDFFWDARDTSLGQNNPASSMIKDASGNVDSDLRHHFSFNTCNGCHAGETHDVNKFLPGSLPFVHITPRITSLTPSPFSDFLNGTDMTIPDPADPSVTRTFNEIERRKTSLQTFADRHCFRTIFHIPTLMTH